MDDKKQPRGLGRGLAALLPETPVILNNGSFGGERVLLLDIKRIKPNPHQPRQHFDEQKLAELAASIKTHGILQPLIVAEGEQEGYIIIAGERRWRAAQSIGLLQVRCIIRSFEQQQLQELSLIENIQRVDLAPLEEALAYRDLLDQYNYTQEALAARLGKSRSYITNTLRLLTLAPQFQEMLRQGTISAGHARALLSLADEPKQARLAALYDAAGLPPVSDDPAGKAGAFIQALRDMNARLGIPASFECIREGDVPEIAARAVKESNPLYPVPRIWRQEECEGVVRGMAEEEKRINKGLHLS